MYARYENASQRLLSAIRLNIYATYYNMFAKAVLLGED
jgi:hypothetical protein